MARVLGLEERPGDRYVSRVESGKCRLPPRRWKYIRKVVSKEEVLDAYVADIAEEWEKEYGA
jgi:hypothetical protein